MRNAVLHLRATEPTDLAALAVDLDRELNRPGEPVVTVAVDGQALAFECPTWGPILKSKVLDALDALLGAGSGDAFEIGDTRWA